MTSTTAELENIPGHHVPRKEKNRAQDLRHARKMIDGLQARSAAESGASAADLNEFTEILSTVMDVLQRLEMQDNADDSGTAATLPETVATTNMDELSTHSIIARLDDSYDESTRDHDCQSLYDEPRRVHSVGPRRVQKHKRRQVEQRHESFDDIVLDETEFSQGLSGYEDGFYPEVCDCDTSIDESFAGPTVSVLGCETPRTRRTKATVSVSEESQCFYCATHGHEGGCSGTRFCC